jgi:hypothetical protein
MDQLGAVATPLMYSIHFEPAVYDLDESYAHSVIGEYMSSYAEDALNDAYHEETALCE